MEKKERGKDKLGLTDLGTKIQRTDWSKDI